MFVLSREKLKKILTRRGLNIHSLARKSGISRQSLYTMFQGGPVFNTPFLKVIQFLNLAPDDLLEKKSPAESMLEEAPSKIKKNLLELIDFCQKQRASLVLFGSRGRGTASAGADWDFGVYFHKKIQKEPLCSLKNRLQGRSFPYRIDVINLNEAPDWFMKGVLRDGLLLSGSPLPPRDQEAA